jgi:imidazole glycerol-phosphate synthase subunit HisH
VIAIIDYHAGNLASVARALGYLGFQCRITQEAKEIIQAERVILPGVGSAGQAMLDLKQRGLDKALNEVYQSGKPILGICLGSQIILQQSEENNTACLGLLPGMVQHFPAPLITEHGNTLKVPHMGWNRVRLRKGHPVFRGITSEHEFYFVHSYVPVPDSDNSIIGTTEYGISFASIVGDSNLVAVQFHPEKSGPIGLTILKNFCQWDT